MSSDMMIICKEDNSSYERNDNKAFFVDECSMGDPSSEFGKWFGERFCKAPSMLEQMHGLKQHDHIEFTEADLLGVKEALKNMSTHDSLDKEKLMTFLVEHVGMHVSTENW